MKAIVKTAIRSRNTYKKALIEMCQELFKKMFALGHGNEISNVIYEGAIKDNVKNIVAIKRFGEEYKAYISVCDSHSYDEVSIEEMDITTLENFVSTKKIIFEDTWLDSHTLDNTADRLEIKN